MLGPAPLEAQELRVRLGGREILTGLDLRAPAGRVTALLGPNGAGKTTFIRACTGLAPVTSGTLQLFGSPPGSDAVRERVGLMPQSTGAWSGITAGHLLRYLASLYASPHPPEDLMARLGIDDFATTPYRRLSGGEQQAVNLAGALIGRPSLVFLDEPTSGLDVRARRRTWELVSQLRASGVAVLLTTHDMLEAAELADEVNIIDQGRITARGTVAELTANASLEDVFLANTSGDR